MKCKVCGGTGTSNTCVNGTFKPCTFCDGTGEYEPFDADVELDKLYPTEQTNEEWLRTATTEQLAEWIADKINDTVYSMSIDAWAGDVDRGEYWQRKSEWAEWLKQPHTEKE